MKPVQHVMDIIIHILILGHIEPEFQQRSLVNDWVSIARRRQRPSAGAHATAAIEADGRGTDGSAPWPTSLTQSNGAGDAPGPRARVMYSSSQHQPQNV